MGDLPVDLLKTLFGIDVPDSYDSLVSVIILIVALWGAETVVQRLKRAKEEYEQKALERREKALAEKRQRLIGQAAANVRFGMAETPAPRADRSPACGHRESEDGVRPDEVHPSHDVREEGILVSDPVCQKCRASVYGIADRLRVECPGTVKESLTVEPLSKTYELPETAAHWKALAKHNGNTLVQKAMDIAALEARATAAEAREAKLREALRTIASCESHFPGDAVDIARAALETDNG